MMSSLTQSKKSIHPLVHRQKQSNIALSLFAAFMASCSSSTTERSMNSEGVEDAQKVCSTSRAHEALLKFTVNDPETAEYCIAEGWRDASRL